MKASVWLQLVRRDFGMLDILNESSTKIPWKVDYLFTAVVLKIKKCPKIGYWISVHRLSLAQWKHRFDFSWFAVTSVWYIEWKYYNPLKSRLSLHSSGAEIEDVPWKVDTEFQSSNNESISWFADFGILKMNECSANIPWKVDNLFTAVILKLKMSKSGTGSVHRFSLAQWKHHVDFSWFAVTSDIFNIMNECSTNIPWKVDYLFTAVVLKLKMCPKSGYWISVHRLESCTMKASCWLQLVRRDFGIMNIMNECSTNIPWKVTAVVLKLKKCPKSGYWISVHRFQSCTMKASVWLQMVRRDFGMLDILNV